MFRIQTLLLHAGMQLANRAIPIPETGDGTLVPVRRNGRIRVLVHHAPCLLTLEAHVKQPMPSRDLSNSWPQQGVDGVVQSEPYFNGAGQSKSRHPWEVKHSSANHRRCHNSVTATEQLYQIASFRSTKQERYVHYVTIEPHIQHRSSRRERQGNCAKDNNTA